MMAKPRNSIVRFARMMEDTLKRNEDKGGWAYCTDEYLSGRLIEETTELLLALRTRGNDDILRECCDVANFAMMIADNRGMPGTKETTDKERTMLRLSHNTPTREANTMKITYHHIRRPSLISTHPAFLEANIEYGKKLLKFTQALEHIRQRGIPVNVHTRELCQAVTICEIYPGAGEDFEPVIGVAFCCNKDQFNRKIGRWISYGRARHELIANGKRIEFLINDVKGEVLKLIKEAE